LVVGTRPFDRRPRVSRVGATLGSGVHVTQVGDLRVLVNEGSATQRKIDDTLALDQKSNLLFGAAAGVGGLGLVAATTLLAIDVGLAPQVSPRPTADLSPLLVGGAASFLIGAIGGGALGTWGTLTAVEADDLRTQAFDGFNADLAAACGLSPSMTGAGANPAAPPAQQKTAPAASPEAAPETAPEASPEVAPGAAAPEHAPAEADAPPSASTALPPPAP
jgi:hypothetical protein